MIFLAVDPGAQGGIALIFPDDTVSVYPYTSTKLIELCRILASDIGNISVAVEKVHAMPQNGVTSMFTFGTSYGRILGILESFDISYQLVQPSVWKKFVGVTADKKTSISRAQKLFPEVSLLPTKRSRVPNDGLAEALLLAHYLKCKSLAKI